VAAPAKKLSVAVGTLLMSVRSVGTMRLRKVEGIVVGACGTPFTWTTPLPLLVTLGKLPVTLALGALTTTATAPPLMTTAPSDAMMTMAGVLTLAVTLPLPCRSMLLADTILVI